MYTPSRIQPQFQGAPIYNFQRPHLQPPPQNPIFYTQPDRRPPPLQSLQKKSSGNQNGKQSQQKDRPDGLEAENIVNNDKFQSLLEEFCDRDLFYCQICQDILWEPESCQNCNKNFCTNCIQLWIGHRQVNQRNKNKPSSCPSCKDTYIGSQTAKTIKNSLRRLKFWCKNKEYGCMQHIPLEEYTSHMIECEFIIDTCKNQGCTFKGTRYDIKRQHEQDCEYGEIVKSKFRQQTFDSIGVDEEVCNGNNHNIMVMHGRFSTQTNLGICIESSSSPGTNPLQSLQIQQLQNQQSEESGTTNTINNHEVKKMKKKNISHNSLHQGNLPVVVHQNQVCGECGQEKTFDHERNCVMRHVVCNDCKKQMRFKELVEHCGKCEAHHQIKQFFPIQFQLYKVK